MRSVIFLVTWTLFCQQSLGLEVDPNGIYSDIIVEISDKVPRQKCQRALDNLEVRIITVWSSSFLVTFAKMTVFKTISSSSMLICSI